MQLVLYHRKGRECIMRNYDFKKYSLPIEPSLRSMRVKKSPQIQLENEHMFVVDELESEGIIKIMEHLSGTLYTPVESDRIDECPANAVLLAEIRVSAMTETKTVKVDSIMCEYGFEDLAHTLMQQVLYFAKFYDCMVSILNLKKQHGAIQRKHL